jgi:hypothetical protein
MKRHTLTRTNTHTHTHTHKRTHSGQGWSGEGGWAHRCAVTVRGPLCPHTRGQGGWGGRGIR